MPANIATKDGNVMYVGAKPVWWNAPQHQILGSNFDSRKAIVVSGLDYSVSKSQVYEGGALVDGHYLIVRDDLMPGNPDRILSPATVGSRYTPVQNVELFEPFDAVIEEGEAIYTSVGVLGHGERLFIVAELPESYWIKEDEFKQYILATNGHTGRDSLTFFATNVRVVCQNTFNVAMRTAQNKLTYRHTTNVRERMQTAMEILGVAGRKFKEAQNLFNELVNKPVPSTKAFEEYIAACFPSPADTDIRKKVNARTQGHRNDVARLFTSESNQTPGTRDTYYALFNSVVEYIDHHQAVRTEKVDNALFGAGSRLKQKALTLALEA